MYGVKVKQTTKYLKRLWVGQQNFRKIDIKTLIILTAPVKGRVAFGLGAFTKSIFYEMGRIL